MQFPSPALKEIFINLGRRELSACSLICRKWRDFANERTDLWFPWILNEVLKLIAMNELIPLLQFCNREKLSKTRFKCLEKLVEGNEV